MLSAILSLALVAQVSSLAVPQVEKRSAYPFNQLVAFGDELSDNGNGSYAHGITGDPANVYGYGTWTSGPVAVSYLADLLGVPLVDYAFGGCCGGGTFGAVIDNSYTNGSAQVNGAPVPSLVDQIHKNYTVSPNNNIKNSMQFIWIGENDLSMHTDAFWTGDSHNSDFATQYATRVAAEAEYLVAQGAPYVFVANIYPKHLAPVTTAFLCQDGSCVEPWGQIIQEANNALKYKLGNSTNNSKFIYHDTFTFMTELLSVKKYFGFTAPASQYCDGDPAVAQWNTCISQGVSWAGADPFFWMNYIQPTSRVHKMIAEDMKTLIDAFLAGKAPW